jgi:hypothetical protein
MFEIHVISVSEHSMLAAIEILCYRTWRETGFYHSLSQTNLFHDIRCIFLYTEKIPRVLWDDKHRRKSRV